MSTVSLSKAVRSNLLSLQSTANIMAKTQNRLATGLKVNSALDNPSNFFTASALNSRAADMSNLLDFMSSGIKTIEAADNGLKSITKTVESMQSTLRQARQDKSFKSEAFSVDAAAAGQLQFSGGAVGTSPVGVSLGNATPTQSTVISSSDMLPPALFHATMGVQFSATGTSVSALDPVTMTVELDGSQSINISITAAMMGSIGDNDDVIDDAAEFAEAISDSLTLSGNSGDLTISEFGDGRVWITTGTSAGSTASVEITASSAHAAALGANVGLSDVGHDGYEITISNGSATASLVLTSSNSATTADARNYITSELAAQGVTGITVGGTGDRIDLAGAADGSNSITVGGTHPGYVFGFPPTVTAGVPASVLSVDQLVQSINSSGLEGKVRASNDGGKLRIENLSAEALTVQGLGPDGEIDGGTGAVAIGGNDVRANLVKQFNDLRDQLDKFADDASFNGINLLRGDRLKLTFNEVGTSTIEIQAKDAAGQARPISSLALGLAEALDSDFDSDADLDTLLDTMKSALDTLRSQSSAFGSNLSVVENRNDFTKSMINTLETGAANLTLADTNQEAANLLALQTRQQLSSSALSMASQADQAVLRLF